jgi:DNA polymerase I
MVTLLIDGPSVFAKSYFALRGKPDVTGEAWGIWEMLNQVREAVRRLQAVQMAICWDGDNLVRRERCPRYKEGREKPDGYYTQAVQAMHLLDCCGYHIASAHGWEADDVIATLARKYRSVVFISADHDLLQLVSPHATMEMLRWSKAQGSYRELVEFGPAHDFVPVKWELLPDYRALVGDKSDNIDGIRGIGPVAAEKICSVLGALENGLKADEFMLNELLGGRFAKIMAGQWERAIWVRDNLIRLNDRLEGLSVGKVPSVERVTLGVRRYTERKI